VIKNLFVLLFCSLIFSCNHQPNQAMQGASAPEIIQKNPQGDELKLSSLKGKMVLIDFWASWCGPCRKNNSDLVELYLDFHNKKFHDADGFEIFSVSLDQNGAGWKKAIEHDDLIWENHTSDLKGWKNEAAVAYNVHEIPFSYLIDENGTIICVNCSFSRIKKELNKRLTE